MNLGVKMNKIDLCWGKNIVRAAWGITLKWGLKLCTKVLWPYKICVCCMLV